MGESVSQLLEPIAEAFRTLNLPEVIVQWGHPLMMGIVVFVLGSYTAYAGWRGRLATDQDVSLENRAAHRKLAPWLFLFVTLGYTGGVLSLVMQHHPIFESPHFWTGSLVILLLGLNGGLSLIGFGGENKEAFRTAHAYIGGIIMILLVIHGFLGLNLGLSLM